MVMRRTSLHRTKSLTRRTRVKPRNAKRMKRLRAVQFGVQAQLCRESKCTMCKSPPPSDPHHVKSRGAGGKDEDCLPFCRTCHSMWHSYGRDYIERYLAKYGIDIEAAITEMRRRVKEAEQADNCAVSPLLGMVGFR